MIPSARGHWFQTSPHVPEVLTPLIVDHVKRGLIISAHLVVDLAAPSVQRGGAVDRTHYGYLQSSELIQARIQDPGRGPRRKVALSDQTENPQPASKRSVGSYRSMGLYLFALEHCVRDSLQSVAPYRIDQSTKLR